MLWVSGSRWRGGQPAHVGCGWFPRSLWILRRLRPACSCALHPGWSPIPACKCISTAMWRVSWLPVVCLFFPQHFSYTLCDLARSLYSSELIALTSSEEHRGGGQAACRLSHHVSASMETAVSLLVKLCTPPGRILSWSVWGGLPSARTAPWILLREKWLCPASEGLSSIAASAYTQ